MGKNVWISQFVYLDELHPEGITIGDNATIGLRTSVFTHFYWGRRRDDNGFREVVIGSGAFIGPHCLILPGVRVGDNSVIKGGSILSKDVTANTFWGPTESGPIARVTVPLTPGHEYSDFIRGLKPLRKQKRS